MKTLPFKHLSIKATTLGIFSSVSILLFFAMFLLSWLPLPFGDADKKILLLFLASTSLFLIWYSGWITTLSFNYLDISLAIFLIYSMLNMASKDGHLPALVYNLIIDLAVICIYISAKACLLRGRISEEIFFIIPSLLAVLQEITVLLHIFKTSFSSPVSLHITGGFSNPGPFSIYLSSLCAFILPLLMYYWNNHKKRILFSLLLLCSLVLILLSQSRSAWLGVLITFPFGYLLGKDATVEFEPTRRKLFVTFCIFSVTTGLIISLFFKEKQASTTGRLFIWKNSFEVIKDHFLTGVGRDNFEVIYPEYQFNYFKNHPVTSIKYEDIAGDARYAFNDFIQIVCEEGVIGTLLCMFVFIILTTSVWRQLKAKQKKLNTLLLLCCYCCLLSILVSGLTSYPMEVTPIRIHFIVSLAFLSALLPSKKLGTKGINLGSRHLTIILFCVIVSFLFISIARLVAFKQLKNEKVFFAYDNRLFKIVVSDHPYVLYKEGINHLENHSDDRAVQTFRTALLISQDKEIYYALADAYMRQGKFEEAKHCLNFVSISQPSLMTPKYLLAKLYFKNNNQVEFIKIANAIVKMKPKVETFATITMQNEIAQLLVKSN